MLSRVAASIYWMSRYVERAENVARSVDVNQHVVLDLPSGLPEQWDAVVKITGDYAAFKERYPQNSKDDVIEFLTFDRQNPNSITCCIRTARENARSIREIISSEMWEELNAFYLELQHGSSRERARDAPHDFFRDVRRASHLLEGVTNNTLSHGEAYHFFRLGRMLERADQTTRILDIKYFLLLPDLGDVGTTVDDLYWSAILRSASAFEMYRKVHGQIAADRTAEFLVLDREFPRSVHFCAMRAADSLHFITGTPRGRFQNLAEQCLGRLVAQLDYTDINELIDRGLHESLDHLQSQLNDVGDSIYETFFS